MFAHVILSLAAASTLTVTVEPVQTLSAPRGAQHVQMMRLLLHADCSGDITVEELQLRRRGLGLHTDIVAVYAEQEGLRASNAASVARDGAVVLRLHDLTIAACGESTLIIFMDLSADADIAGEHRLELPDAEGVSAPGAQVLVMKSSAVPGKKNVRTAGDSVGSVAVEYLRLLKLVRYGDRRIVSRLRLSASGVRDQLIERITFTNAGSASNNDLRNIALRDARGERLSPVVDHLQGDRVVILLDPPLRIAKGGARTVELTADVRASSRRTLRFLIEEPGDIVSREARGRAAR